MPPADNERSPEEIVEDATQAIQQTGRSIDDMPEPDPEVPMTAILHVALLAAVAEAERHGLRRDDLRIMIFADVPPDVDMKFRTGLEVVGPIGSAPEALDWALQHLAVFAEHNGLAFTATLLEDGEAPEGPKA